MVDRAPWYGSLLTLLLVCCSVGHAKSPARGSEEARQLHAQAVRLNDSGHYREGIPIALRALALHEKILGAEHPDIAPVAENLGLLYFRAGDFAIAESVYLRA